MYGIRGLSGGLGGLGALESPEDPDLLPLKLTLTGLNEGWPCDEDTKGLALELDLSPPYPDLDRGVAGGVWGELLYMGSAILLR